MKPIRLEINRLRSFREKRVIDFTDLQIFAIVGDTGAGKTSILEAITYALFNRSTWSGRNVKELISKGESTMSVLFKFSVDGDEFEIYRLTRERGAPIHRLICAARGIDVSHEAAVDSAIRNALHLDDNAFLHTVLLPQDKHAELLTKNQNDRNKILSELFRLDDLAKIGELARVHEGRAESHLFGLSQQLRECGDDPAYEVQQAESALNVAVTTGERASAALASVAKCDAESSDCQKTIDGHSRRSAELLGTDEILQQLESIDGMASALERAIVRQKAAQGEASADKERAEKQAEALRAAGHDRAALRTIEKTLQALTAELAELARERQEKTLAEGVLKISSKKLEQFAEQVKAAGIARDSALRAVNESETKWNEKQAYKVNLENAMRERSSALRRRDSDRKNLESKSIHEKSLRRELGNASKVVAKARDELANASAKLQRESLANSAAAIGRHLHVGDDCPVCQQAVPKGFKRPANADLSRAADAEKNAKRELEKASSKENKLHGQLTQATAAVAEAKLVLRSAESELAGAEREVAKLLPRASADSTKTLTGCIELIAELKGKLPALQSDLNSKNSKLSQLKIAHAELQTARRHSNDLIEMLRRSSDERKKHADTLLKSLPAAFAASEKPGSIQKALTAVQKAYEKADQVESDFRKSSGAFAAAVTQLNSLQQELSTKIVAPRATLYEKLQTIAKTLDFEPLHPADGNEKQWAKGLVSAAQRARVDIEDKVAKALKRKDELVELRATIVTEIGGDPQTIATEAAVRKRDAQRDLEAARQKVLKLAAIREKIGQLEPVKLGMSSLKNALGARAFPMYATQRRQRRLLEEATIILQEMTDNRFGFTDEFEIFDRETNKTRSPQTLSGGEKFLASLALSLGVVEIASNAGAKIESLFLDEGFASLDAETLELAMLELRKRSRVGRMICVISHLSQVTQFVDSTIFVERTADGTDVKRISGPIDDDASVAPGLVSQLAISVT